MKRICTPLPVNSLVLIFLGWLCVSLTAAEAPTASATRAVLNLTDGGFVPGELLGSEDTRRVRWQSPHFLRPLEFSLGHVNAVHFPSGAQARKNPVDAPAKPEFNYRFELPGGDELIGNLIGWTEESVEVEAAHVGRVSLRRDQVRYIHRWESGGATLFAGPNGLDGWEQSKGDAPWREEVGHLVADQEGAFILRDVGLTPQAYIEVELSWNKKADFLISLGVIDKEEIDKQAFRLEVFDNEIVVQRETKREADLAIVQTVEPGAGRLHLLLFLDQQKESLQVFSASGKPLGQINVETGKPKTYGCIRLMNKRGDLRLERLRVSRWSGALPQQVLVNKPRVHLADGTIQYGQVSSFDPEKRQFTIRDGEEEKKIAEQQITIISVSPSPPETAVPNASDPTQRQDLRVTYQDGTRLSGTLNRIEDQQLVLTHLSSEKPFHLPTAKLRSLVVLHHEKAAMPLSGRKGMLELDGVRLAGWLVPSGADASAHCLVWQPELGHNASPLAPDLAGRIVYREPPPRITVSPQPQVMQQPQQQLGFFGGLLNALAGNPNNDGAGATTQPPQPAGREGRSLHLRTGDTIPCEVTGINEEGVSFRTSVSDATFVTHDKVKAVELATGFNSPKLAKKKRERLLMLPRMQKDSPPTQLICSKNGDFLRGRVLALDEKKLSVEVRLENKEVARERIAQVIWLHPDELGDALTALKSQDSPPPEFANAMRVQALRSDGIRLTFFADRMGEKELAGKSDVLGPCRADVTKVDQLLFGTMIEKAAAELAYHQWKLRNAPEPKFARSEDGEPAEPRSPGSDSPLVGQPAPDIKLEMLDGKVFHLVQEKGKVVVLDFWATWCGPCLQAMPQVERVTQEFADQNVRLVAVNLEESPKQIQAMLERHKLNVTVALDRDGVAAARYAATAIPQTVIVDRDGKVARLFVGGGPRFPDQLRTALQEVLAGGADAEKPSVPTNDKN